jgi:DNA-binding transcriptional MerR regulator
MVEEGSRDGPGDGEWLTVAAAARRLGVSPRAIRGRIRRGTISTKANGNAGKLAEARATIARLEERVAAARGVATADVEAAKRAAEEAIAARDELVNELRRTVEHERARADRVEAEALRSWWRRLLGR